MAKATKAPAIWGRVGTATLSGGWFWYFGAMRIEVFALAPAARRWKATARIAGTFVEFGAANSPQRAARLAQRGTAEIVESVTAVQP